jgi:hypothetical protein
MPIILATQVAQIRRITVQSQPRQIVPKTLSRKHPSQKGAGGVAQVVGPEFKSQYHKKTQTTTKRYTLLPGPSPFIPHSTTHFS